MVAGSACQTGGLRGFLRAFTPIAALRLAWPPSLAMGLVDCGPGQGIKLGQQGPIRL